MRCSTPTYSSSSCGLCFAAIARSRFEAKTQKTHDRRDMPRSYAGWCRVPAAALRAHTSSSVHPNTGYQVSTTLRPVVTRALRKNGVFFARSVDSWARIPWQSRMRTGRPASAARRVNSFATWSRFWSDVQYRCLLEGHMPRCSTWSRRSCSRRTTSKRTP